MENQEHSTEKMPLPKAQPWHTPQQKAWLESPEALTFEEEMAEVLRKD